MMRLVRHVLYVYWIVCFPSLTANIERTKRREGIVSGHCAVVQHAVYLLIVLEVVLEVALSSVVCRAGCLSVQRFKRAYLFLY